ncbi:hypothetical protein [Bacillus rhizoplanae]|uniref:hypothetical protein n=1 Tax=Bacillus rhizoplanae TaxID=2880966 RepID=UPI003D1A8322
MERKSPLLLVQKLVLVGVRKNYTVNFNDGLNIIYGDSDTGKSSILNLIDYLLGAKEVQMYEEIEKSGKYALLQVKLNNKVYTIKRDIFNPSEYIEVYHATIEDMDNVFPKLYGHNYSKEGPAGFFSDFLLQSLNLPLIKVRKAPTKQDSELSRLSFRDLFKFCYIDQDVVGSRYLLDIQNYAVATKNRQTFKFIFNLLDTQISELQQEIQLKVKNQKKLNEQYHIVSSFLREAQFQTAYELEDLVSNTDVQIIEINNEIQRVDIDMKADTIQFESLRKEVGEMERELRTIVNEKRFSLMLLDQNISLKSEYEQDLKKLQLSLQMAEKLPSHLPKVVECPLCLSDVQFSELEGNIVNLDLKDVKDEINSLKNKIKEVQLIIKHNKENVTKLENEEIIVKESLSEAKAILDSNLKDFISPYVAQREFLVKQRSNIEEQLSKHKYHLKIRRQLEELEQDAELLGNQISELKKKLEGLKEEAPSIDVVLDNLADKLAHFLRFIPIKNPRGINVSPKTYLPIVRNKDYVNLTSGGLRTIVSVGYLISLLKESLESETNLPSFLMIDTIGKYLGKIKDTEKAINEKEEELDDPTKYTNMYKYLLSLTSNNTAQVIVVDNEIPTDLLYELKDKVVKRFGNSKEVDTEIGFIDDAKSTPLD